MSGLLTLLTLLSLILALRQRAPLSIYAYLLAQLIYIPPVMLVVWLLGVWSPWYALVYVVFTLPILASIAWIVSDVLLERHYRLRPLAIALVLALMLGRIAYFGLGRPVTYFDWINLALGVLLATAGIVTAYTAPYLARCDLALILSLLWLGQSISCFGWALHLWERWNFLLDPAMGIVAFSLLAWRLRGPSERSVRVRES